jgi:hypothetical protein
MPESWRVLPWQRDLEERTLLYGRLVRIVTAKSAVVPIERIRMVKRVVMTERTISDRIRSEQIDVE